MFSTLKHIARPAALYGAIVCAIALSLTISALADASGIGLPSWIEQNYAGRGGSGSCRVPPWVRTDVRDIREVDRERGARDGYRTGYSQGREDGYHGHGHNRHCTIDISRESRSYQRGFLAAFESGYDAGYHAGRAQRERERCHSSRPIIRWDWRW